MLFAIGKLNNPFPAIEIVPEAVTTTPGGSVTIVQL